MYGAPLPATLNFSNVERVERQYCAASSVVMSRMRAREPIHRAFQQAPDNAGRWLKVLAMLADAKGAAI
jgi:hypothetical protein